MKSVFNRKQAQSPVSDRLPSLAGTEMPSGFVVVAGPAPDDATLCHHIRAREASEFDLRFDFFPAGTAPQTGHSIRIGPDLLDRAWREMSLPVRKIGIAPCLSLRDRQLTYLWRAIMDEALAGGPGGSAHMARLGQVLASRVALLLPGTSSSSVATPSQLSGPVRTRLAAFIDANLDGDLSLATLATVAGMSASHLKTLFRASFGEPVHGFVMRRRVERARQLIEAGGLPLAQIALETGFSHQSHMARWMRRLIGVTPAVLGRSATGQARPQHRARSH